MGHFAPHPPVLLIVAAFSRHDDALAWGRSTMEATWGPIALTSPAFDFHETEYYTPSMGSGLRKQFFAFERRIDPTILPALKHQANDWEAAYAKLGRHAEERPLNLDPGYLTSAKLVLASTKDFAHRIYLADGIYAEITLHFRRGVWQPHEFTFPDYRRADYQAFFSQCREYLRAAP